MIVPPGVSYVGWLQHHARVTPGAEAWVHDGRRATYAALHENVTRCAAGLARSGVGPGDRVAMLGAPDPRFWTILLATHALGAIWVGIGPRYTLPEILHVLTDCAPALWCTSAHVGTRDMRPEVDAVRAALPELPVVMLDRDLSTLCPEPTARSELPPFTAAPDTPALIVYTSGTTGKPKGALLSHRAITSFCRGQAERWQVAAPRVVMFSPINHVSASLDSCGCVLAAGGTILFLDQFDPMASLDLLEREQATVWGGMPTTLQMQLDLPGFAARDLSAVRLIAWGGAALSPATITRLQAVCPWMATNYGLTESASAITVLAPTVDRAMLARSVGTPLPGVEMRIVDPATREPCARGEHGEIEARSALNMLGYWRDEHATRAAFTADGFIKTGDLGRLGDDGHLELRGRLRDMFKSGGYNVYPREIEAVLEALPGVRMAAVVGVPDPVWQESGVAFVEATDLSEADLAACSRAALANYKVPKRFILVDQLPMLANGKVDRVLLSRTARA